MRSFFLIPPLKILFASAGLSAILLLTLSVFSVLQEREYYLQEQAEYSDWANHGPKRLYCEKIFEDAKQQLRELDCVLETIHHEDRRPSLFSSHVECIDKNKEKSRSEIADTLLKSGCRQDYFDRLNHGIPSLLPPPYPGTFISFSKDRVISDVVPIFEILVPFVVFLFIFTSIVRSLILETHTGWKRLTIVVSGLTAVLVPVIFQEDFKYETKPIFPILIYFASAALGTAASIIYGRKVILWVHSGFKDNVQQGAVGTKSSPPAAPVPQQDTMGLPVPEPTLNFATFWPRLWARCIDLPLVWLMASIVCAFIPSFSNLISGSVGLITDVAFFMLVFCVAILAYDTLWLSKVGTTPGKALFGLYVRNVDGRLPTINEAILRSRKLLSSGLYYTLFFPMIQIFSVYTRWKSRDASAPWDLDGRTIVHQRSIGWFRYAVAVMIAISCITSMVILQKAAKLSTKQELLKSFFD